MMSIMDRAGSQRSKILINLDMDKIKPQIEHVNKNEILLKDEAQWLHFTAPYHSISIDKLEQVPSALREVERLVNENHWYAAGFLSYEAAPAFDPALHTKTGSEFPFLWFGLYPEPHLVSLPQPSRPKESLPWLPMLDRETYNESIAEIKRHIAEGRTYQVNYTMRMQSSFDGDAWDFFLHLVQNQNRQAAYINLGRYVIASASPELFFQLNGNNITCRPMKGTTRRGRTNAEDREQSEWLRNSAKNRAENVMIVDMIRNDLGRIAEIGSVSVPRLFETERYPTLWQMTSTVQAKSNASVTEIFGALFPSASITGAPKVSTMRIIAELENTPRRIYTGSIGYLFPGRRAKFNVAIRTALIDMEASSAEYGVGGGIVWDSDSTDEYAEAMLKARVLTEASPPFSLLETMLWSPEKSFFLREKHVERMLGSAEYFEIPITRETLESYLEQISSGFCTSLRVRVLLDQLGNLTSEFRALNLTDELQPLKVCLARDAIDSRDIFLFHKTTRRDIYETQRSGLEEFDDILLYNERAEVTEFTLGNLVAELDGELVTPPVSSGLLAGVFRGYLLETGQVAERTILMEDLEKCLRLFRVNSVRQWQMVDLKS